MNGTFPIDPPGLPPCVEAYKARLAGDWPWLTQSDQKARASALHAQKTITESAVNQLMGKEDALFQDGQLCAPKIPEKYRHYGVDAMFLCRVMWLGENCDLSKPDAWKPDPGFTDSQIAAFKKAKRRWAENTSFGEKVLKAIERALRKGDWGFVRRMAEINLEIERRTTNKRGGLRYTTRDVLIARNWVRFHDVDADRPGLAWFKGKSLMLANKLLQLKDPGSRMTPQRLNIRAGELGLKRIHSPALAKLPLADWAEQMLQSLD